VIVVTSNYHTRRARYIFRRVFPQGMEVRVASARDGDFDPAHWWEKRKSIKELTREFAGMVAALWELKGGSETGEDNAIGSGIGRTNSAISGVAVQETHQICYLPFLVYTR